MTIVLNSSTGITTPPVSVQGSTSGTITLVAPAVAGDNTQTLLAATGTLSPFNSGTAQTTTSGTSIDFTSIPSWVRRITVMLSGVSTSGTSLPRIQIGAGSITTSGYLGSSAGITSNAGFGSVQSSGGFDISTTAVATAVMHGALVLVNLTGNTWAISGVIGQSDTTRTAYIGGSIALGGTLDRVRITTVNGTDTFDAGSINLLYE
jgi:hypothetical protein